MTAYAGAEKTAQQLKVSIEIRSYNSRHFDIAIRLPHGYQDLEEKIKSLVAQKIARGRIEIRVQIMDESEESYLFETNEPKAHAYHKALRQLRDQLNIDAEVSLELLVSAGGIITPLEVDRDMEVVWPIIRDCLSRATDDLVAMRKREGDFIGKDIVGRLDHIEKILDQIKEESKDLLNHYQERLKERILVLTKGMIEIDPVRIAQEAALLANRSDIAEEIVRAESHINHFRTIMNSAEPAGRKLNFLLQEFNREFNTMGSKTEKADVSHMIVEVKSELEKIREQVQNIE
ncbi:YicC/YloC family endoribonuclease [Thermodesulfobacteriota bacterium]